MGTRGFILDPNIIPNTNMWAKQSQEFKLMLNLLSKFFDFDERSDNISRCQLQISTTTKK